MTKSYNVRIKRNGDYIEIEEGRRYEKGEKRKKKGIRQGKKKIIRQRHVKCGS